MSAGSDRGSKVEIVRAGWSVQTTKRSEFVRISDNERFDQVCFGEYNDSRRESLPF